MKTLVFLGNYAPRCCGIATFTQDLRSAVLSADPSVNAPVAMVSDDPERYTCPEEVQLILSEKERSAYRAAAESVNRLNADAVSLQHEFGIYGGPSGSWILDFLKHVKAPVVTTCHTVLREPSPEQRQVLQSITRHSDRVIVMAEKGRELLKEIYGVPDEKIAVIPHGIPDAAMTREERAAVRESLGWSQRRVLLTFGLVGPSKGIEQAIMALPEIVKQHPNALYVVTGATHPNLLRDQGENYRERLQALAEELNVAEHLQFINRFVSRAELVQLIGAADVYLTPYLNEAQITSGTLAYAFGMGKPVISTPYWHAAELLADDHGILVPFRDTEQLAKAANVLFQDDSVRESISARAYQKGREMTWDAVGRRYNGVIEDAVALRRRAAIRTAVATVEAVPQPAIHHFAHMTGEHGIHQHAIGTEPDPVHGYCTDDNARAVIALTDLMRINHPDNRIGSMFTRCFNVLIQACDLRTDRFRNFMSEEGEWLESYGSEDSHGRAVWALGHVVHHCPSSREREYARKILRVAAPAVVRFTSPRAWAFTLMGITNYLDGVRSDILTEILRDELASRLFSLYERYASDDWLWFENNITYDNAKLPEALLAAARQTGKITWCRAALRTLGFLVRSQTALEGHFRPVGCQGFWQRGGRPAQWDQQPLEAQAMTSACLEAYKLTGQMRWLDSAWRAFAWFTGGNDHALSLVDEATGGCCDGLMKYGVNINQGAESTLAWIQSAAQMRLMSQMPAFVLPSQIPAESSATAAA
ncbi:MAG TPA: glycosyltransferase [Verrucomicrobiales bacterium]|nr:glycosyltransferase [Verrucomicrobiales bacterium]